METDWGFKVFWSILNVILACFAVILFFDTVGVAHAVIVGMLK